MIISDYNGFRGVLNQKSIPLKTTEEPQRAAENPYKKLCGSLCLLCGSL